MATRNDIQIAQDLIRFMNIMNDLLDCTSYILKGIDPQTGGPYMIQENGNLREPTFDELRDDGKRAAQNVLGYWQMISEFINGYGAQNVQKALTSLGINLGSYQSDLALLQAEAQYLNNSISGAQSKADLIVFADRLDLNVPKIVLVRRTWCLGL